jgi:hypothetical protein
LSDEVGGGSPKVGWESAQEFECPDVSGAEQITADVNEAISVNEALKAALQLGVRASDAVALADVATVVVDPLLAPVTDAITVADIITAVVDPLLASVNDAIAVAEAIAPDLIDSGISASVNETITLLEQIKAALTRVTKAAEAIAVSEGVTAVLTPLLASVNEAITVADNAKVALQLGVPVSDAITVAEAVTANLVDANLFALVSDAIAIAELVTTTLIDLNVNAVVSDAITVGERLRACLLTGNVQALVDWPDREIVLIAEPAPGYTLTGFVLTAGRTNTYEVSVPRFHGTAIKGGVYARVMGVVENATSLVERTGVQQVEDAASSWYWDADADLLYVHSSSGADPDTFTAYQALRRLHWGTTSITLDDSDCDDESGIYYHPWLTRRSSTIVTTLGDELFGVKATPSATLVLTNGHGWFHDVFAPNGPWNWKGAPVALLFGGSYRGIQLQRSQYQHVATMRIEDVVADEETATVLLKPMTRGLDLLLPRTPIFSSDFPNLGEGVEGSHKPIGYGRAKSPGILVDTTASEGKYLFADPAFQTLNTIHQVWAIAKSTGVRTALTITTHYTEDLTACTVTITDATYTHTSHTIEADITGKTEATFADIAKDMLTTFLGVATADIDAASFTQAALDAPETLSVWLTSPRTIGSIMMTGRSGVPSLERSVLGQLRFSRAGLWEARIRSVLQAAGVADVTLEKRDFAVFSPRPSHEGAFATTKVFHNRNLSTGAWAVETHTDMTAQFLLRTEDHAELHTFLRTASDAQILAQRYQIIAGGRRLRVEFEERGCRLFGMLAGDVLGVTFAPALDASGVLQEERFELVRLEKSYVPTVQTRGLFRDMRGLGVKGWAWADESASANWAAASAEEQSLLGFWAGADGRIDPADPATADIKVWG